MTQQFNRELNIDSLGKMPLNDLIEMYRNGYRIKEAGTSIESMQTNLVINPGFELGTTIPSNWAFSTKNGITPFWDNTIARTGTRSVKISIPGTTNSISGNVTSDFIISGPGIAYTFSAWGKTDGLLGTAYPTVYIGEYDSGQTYIKQTIIAFPKGTSDWTQKSVNIITGSTTAYVKVYANLYNTYGTFWIDDLSLIQTTAQPPGYNCTAPGNCQYVASGGQYPDLASCQSSCTALPPPAECTADQVNIPSFGCVNKNYLMYGGIGFVALLLITR